MRGKRQTYDSSFLKSRERWRRGDDNLGFFDSSFLEFQETRELRVERQRRGNGRDISKVDGGWETTNLAFGSTLKIDESLNSINAHLPHLLTTYADQFLLSLPFPYPFPPHPTPLSSSSSRRLSILVTWSLSSNQSICPSFPLERNGAPLIS